MKKMDTEEFIKRAKTVHGDRFDYSQVAYQNNVAKVKIICPSHGIFQQTPANHLKEHGCPKCFFNSRKDWSDEQDRVIKKYYASEGAKYCAEKIGKTVNAVRQRANNIGIYTIFERHEKHDFIPTILWTRMLRDSKRKSREVSIDRDYIWKIYQSQKGFCALTGWPINFSKGGRASVDRIDSSKGYIKGNIQIVDFRVNRAKRDYTDEFFYKICESVARNRRNDLNDGQIHFDSGEVTRKTGRLSESSCPSQEMREVEL